MFKGVLLALCLFAGTDLSQANAQGTETREILLVFFSTPECPCNGDPQFASSISSLKRLLDAQARATSGRLRTLGVSLGGDVRADYAYLVEGRAPNRPRLDFGPWDEVHVGRGWLNAVAARYMWIDRVVPARFAQVAIIERTVRQTSQGYEIGQERLIRVIMAGDELHAFVAGGAKLDFR